MTPRYGFVAATALLFVFCIWTTIAEAQRAQELYDEATQYLSEDLQITDSQVTGLVEEALQGVYRFRDLLRDRNNKLLLLEGDSWFNLPGKADVAEELERMDYPVVSIAHYGDTLERMLYDHEQLSAFGRMLAVLQQNDRIPSAILLSAGGNDFLGSYFPFVIDHIRSETPSLNRPILAGALKRLQRTLMQYLAAIRGMCNQVYDGCRSIPILVHGYDYPRPSGRGYGFWVGPWLRPAFTTKGYDDESENRRTLEWMMDNYNEAVCEAVQQLTLLNRRDWSERVAYVDLRGIVGDRWSDEIHPTREAASDIAKALVDAIETVRENPDLDCL